MGGVERRVLIFRSRDSALRTILRRVGLLVGVFALALVILILDREGLRYNDGTDPDRPVSILDTIYYASVTISTVGYGDIVPVTPLAKLIDIVVLNMARLIIWVTLFGTAYELVYRRFLEERRMKQIQKHLEKHTIVCGYGDQGQAAAAELQLRGVAPDRLVVIDKDETAGQLAADRGFIALKGDASAEEMLRLALIERAKTIIVTTGRDDSNLLIVLTAHDLNRELNVITSVRSDENYKLMKRGGASTVVMSSNLSGRILASAAAGEHSPNVLTDILSSGGQLRLVEREARLDEVGRRPGELAGRILIQVFRDGRPCPLGKLRDWEIAGGDVLLYLEENP